MSDLSKNEKLLIKSLIDGSNESSIIDFKQEWYNFEKKIGEVGLIRNKYEFLKDCISFLNVEREMHKYIVIGVLDSCPTGSSKFVNYSYQPKENNLQELIQSYIDPTPQIDIINDVIIDGNRVDVIRIRRENLNQPYLFKKAFGKNAKNPIHQTCVGKGFIRQGSITKEIDRMDLERIYSKKSNSLFGYFRIESGFNYDYLSDMLRFIHSMDLMVRKDVLESNSMNNPIFKSKLLNIFQRLVIEGLIFQEVAVVNNDEYLQNLVINGSNNFEYLRSLLDGGENSIIALIFCASYNWYQLYTNKTIEVKSENGYIIVEYDENEINYDKFISIDKNVKYLNNIFKEIERTPYRYSQYLNLFKFREIKYSDNISRFLEVDLKYHVSEDIISLLIEPLYNRNDKLEVSLRELLQNSLDACKQLNKTKNKGHIRIEYSNNENGNFINFTDNGIGMSLSDIKDFYLAVGKSNKADSSKMLVGRFGIGALSMFLISKKVTVTTKHRDDFEYSFELLKDDLTAHNLIRRKVEEDNSYTSIKLELNEKYNFKSIEDFIEHANIDSWVVNSEINIQVKYGNETYCVPNIKDALEYFQCVYDDANTKVLMFDERKYSYSDDINTSNINLISTIRATRQILYNDILIDGEYQTYGYNVRQENIPFLVIECKKQCADIDIELSRGTMRLSKRIFENIVNSIYQRESELIAHFLLNNQHKTDPQVMKSNIVDIVRKYVKLPEILLKKNHITILNSNLMKDKSYPNVMKVYMTYINTELIRFDDHQFFDLRTLSREISWISNRFDYDEIILVSSSLLCKYTINANNNRTGLRMDVMKKILNHFMPEENWNYGHDDLWELVSIHRNHLKNKIDMKTYKGFVCFDSECKSFIDNYFASTNGRVELLVVRDRPYKTADKLLDPIICSMYPESEDVAIVNEDTESVR